jgi:hypothetical protein
MIPEGWWAGIEPVAPDREQDWVIRDGGDLDWVVLASVCLLPGGRPFVYASTQYEGVIQSFAAALPGVAVARVTITITGRRGVRTVHLVGRDRLGAGGKQERNRYEGGTV